MKESELQTKVADYLRLQYPNVVFHSDYGSGVKLTVRQATIQKRQNGFRRGWPDMFIAEKSTLANGVTLFSGLFLELKRENTRLKKRNGEWVSDHIAEQAKIIEQLNERGYLATFAVGFDEAKEIIDKYLGGVRK